MTDTDERVKALEERVTALENMVTAAHGKADGLAGFIKRMDDSYYGMMPRSGAGHLMRATGIDDGHEALADR